MNEKIQQLVKQANREIGEKLDQPGVYLDFGPSKYFAELIIEECIQTILKSTTLSDNKPKENYHVYTAAVVDALNGIKEHFGLKA